MVPAPTAMSGTCSATNRIASSDGSAKRDLHGVDAAGQQRAGQRNGVDGAIDDDDWDHRAPLHQIDCRVG
jgi:hypothetical protein